MWIFAAARLAATSAFCRFALSTNGPTMLRRVLLTLLVAFASIPAVANPPAQRVVLGVLEDVPGKYVGEPDSRRVRVVFEKSGDKWRPFRSNCPTQDCLKTIASEYPGEVAWTIAFDGKNLGKVTGRTPKVFDFYSEVGLQDITSIGPVPTVGKKSAEYGGFHGDPVVRPLIANSQPYFKDPEAWKPARLSTASVLYWQFRKKFPNVTN